MMDDGIWDGDVLIVKRNVDAAEIRNGKLVIALLPTGRSVVKRIHFENGKIVLRSANPKFADMIFEPDTITVEGIVKELKRRLD